MVNKLESGQSTLSEHSDNEHDINPASEIFCVSIGATRNVIFRDIKSKKETVIKSIDGSMYSISRHSQNFIKHRIDADPSPDCSVRYSITFRDVHWTHFNSTIVMGDSNFGPIKFGTGQGKVDQSTPGTRAFTPKQ